MIADKIPSILNNSITASEVIGEVSSLDEATRNEIISIIAQLNSMESFVLGNTVTYDIVDADTGEVMSTNTYEITHISVDYVTVGRVYGESEVKVVGLINTLRVFSINVTSVDITDPTEDDIDSVLVYCSDLSDI